MEDIIGALETCGIRDGRDGDVKESALKPSEAKERYLRLEDKFTNLNLQIFQSFRTFRLFCLLELGNSNRLLELDRHNCTRHTTLGTAKGPVVQPATSQRLSDEFFVHAARCNTKLLPYSIYNIIYNIYTIFYTFIIYIYHMHCEFQKTHSDSTHHQPFLLSPEPYASRLDIGC